MFLLQAVAVIALIVTKGVEACSNILITSGASSTGANMVAYNADAASLYGSLYHYPAADHEIDSMRKVFDWDSGTYLGEIKEAQHTFNVVGNTNEKGLIIGETTYGGITALQSQSKAKIDYGSLIWITLQRAATAREAIQTISDLMNTYGYASEGESFSIADTKECWVMEIIGKGEFELGAVWVAHKIPDGAVSAHANQARIQTFPLNDPETALYAQDVISFAETIGLYNATTDGDFSFSDIYDPVSFEGARFCEARVWSFFSTIMGEEFSNTYLGYAQGYDLSNRMPLFVYPSSKIAITDVMEYMRNHYESTDLDMAGLTLPADIGAEDSNTPYRTHPLTWSSTVDPTTRVSGAQTFTYLNERPIATPQTGWNFVAVSRGWMPLPFASVIWFGVDDSGTTARFPIYGSATQVPPYFAGKGSQDGVTPPMMQFSLKSAFYVFNLVANFVYPRWALAYPEVLEKIQTIEAKFVEELNNLDVEVLKIVDANKGDFTDAIEHGTQACVQWGQALVEDWTAFFGQLFVKYRDGYVITQNANENSCGCDVGNAGYSQEWYDRIVKSTGSHYLVEDDSEASLKKRKGKGVNVREGALAPRSKLELLALK